MAQTKAQRVTGVEGTGGMGKLEMAQLNITNNAGETTITITPADAGMAGFVAWFPVNRNANIVSIVPTFVGNLCTSLALTFTANNSIDLFLLGV